MSVLLEALNEISGLLGGASVILVGLITYLGKTRLEALKSEIKSINEHKVHVTKSQFDLELSIYREIWEAMIPLYVSTSSLRPTIDTINSEETEEERINRRFKEFAESYNKISGLIEKNKPFYSKEIYDCLIAVRKLCSQEADEYLDKEYEERRVYWKQARKNRVELNKLVDEACEAIRIRIEQASVIK